MSVVDYDEKLRAAVAELSAKRGPRRRADLHMGPDAPLFRLRIRLGFRLPPLPFWGFCGRALWFGVHFGAAFGTGVTLWRLLRDRPLMAWWQIVFTACLCGLCMAISLPRNPNLPPWRDYVPRSLAGPVTPAPPRSGD